MHFPEDWPEDLGEDIYTSGASSILGVSCVWKCDVELEHTMQ